ncbi:MAG: DUF5684 domain-containing protein [Bacteroidales bacterium]|jgi:hypothetical protein|nr:DUF5684 domain-containing protein [Bacteroidales bacterium]MDD2264718.1 DUF5684 domain-containing protein [Bacteroidales bacterium]MDD2832159.1 DUF5684 domain-containing protein [Bacteroidales bacterium]MDD3209054.1 DUF5684 domain-containing protein [Bacteroidales bacterium]MDD3697939.1 DUF5684 domain-containing protein [Bacteroidales bacterium]
MECFIENLECLNPEYFFILPLIIFGVIIGWYISALLIVAYWFIFKKAGKPVWACIIPVYNILVWLQIIGKPWWWILLMIIPFVNIVFLIWVLNLLAKSFGKRTDFTIGLILLPWIFFPILGFGKSEYNGPAGK